MESLPEHIEIDGYLHKVLPEGAHQCNTGLVGAASAVSAEMGFQHCIFLARAPGVERSVTPGKVTSQSKRAESPSHLKLF
jgi:hypothetical protein